MRLIGEGFKLYFHGVDERRNGVGGVVKEKYINIVLEIKTVSDLLV